ncbi:MAG TPA: methyltransferase domain-containing protein, partial [Chroococcidiopsis sp.]
MKFCKVADIQDWQNEEFPKIESILHSTSRGRKAWEFIHVYYGLQELGLLNGQSRALGLGVGHEPLVFALSNVCGAVVATDLYESQNWSTAAMKTNEVYDKSPFPFERDRLTVQHMDMTQIDFPDNSFDFIWSCCAIEHVNSFKDLHKVYEEIHRVLKPGGVAALTTEYNPTDLHSYEPNMLFTDRYWIDRWFTGENPLVQGFELLDPIDYSIAPLPENEPLPRNTSRHVVQAYVKDIILSSIAFFIRKAGDFSRPYDDQWLEPDWRDYLAACDANRAKQFAQAEALLKPLVDDDKVTVRLRVAAMRRLADALDGQGKTSEIPGLAKTFMQYYDQASCSDHLMSITNSFKRAGLWDDAQRIYERVEQLPG